MGRFLDRILGRDKVIDTVKKQPFFTKDFFESNEYEIGDWSYGHPNVLSWGEGAKLKVGKFCSIADGVVIFLGGNHRTDWVSTYPFNKIDAFPEALGISGHPSTNGDVVIGNDVWLGRGCTILSGITIGDGAVIAAGSMVTKDVRPYEIVGGNPATTIRFRFSDEEIEQLQNYAWWDKPIEEIKTIIPYLLNSDLSFLQKNSR